MLRFYFCLDRNSITLVSGASTSTSIDIETDSSNADDSIPIPNASNSNMPSGVSRFAISESVSKAEILWALKCVWSHCSQRAAEEESDLFRAMFPDSKIAQEFSLGRTKMGYLILYGIFPYFQTKLQQSLRGVKNIVVCFDESLNKISESVSKAEILWALKCVWSHCSQRAAEEESDLFRAMFPDSKIAQEFSLGRTKMGYLILYGIFPYFQTKLQQSLRGVKHIVVCFDESLNKISQRGQMDVVVRFFDETCQRVTTQYYNSAFLGTATADDLLVKFKEALGGVSLKSLYQISMDGPTVNWSFLKKFKEEFQERTDDPQLIEMGCRLECAAGIIGCIAAAKDLNNKF